MSDRKSERRSSETLNPLTVKKEGFGETISRRISMTPAPLATADPSFPLGAPVDEGFVETVGRKMSIRPGTMNISAPGEALVPTTVREWVGWYMYEFAVGAFYYGVCNVLPVFMVAQASFYAQRQYCGDCKNNEWAQNYETIGICSSLTVPSASNYHTNSSCLAVQNATWVATWKDDATHVPFPPFATQGYPSLSATASTVSTLFQMFFLLTFGGIADFGGWRKLLWIASTFCGSVCCIICYFCDDPKYYLLLVWMYIISSVFFNLAYIYYNAFLPLLSWAHPNVIAKSKDSKVSADEVLKDVETINAQGSGRGFACGFGGQFLFLVIMAGVFVVLGTTGWSTRFNIALGGVWAFLVACISFCTVNARPAKPLDSGWGSSPLMVTADYLTIGWRRIGGTFVSIRKLPELAKFIVAYFFFSDGVSTLSTQAAIFASVEFNMGASQIIIMVIILSLCAVFSCWFFLMLNLKCGFSGKRILIFNLAIMGLLPMWPLAGMKTQIEVYLLVVVFGLMTGSLNTFQRSLFSQCIPNGHEAEYFSFYQITDKGTAWLAPLTLTLMYNQTKNFRAGFACLSIFFYLGIFLLLFFDLDKALHQKKAFEKEEKEHAVSGLPLNKVGIKV